MSRQTSERPRLARPRRWFRCLPGLPSGYQGRLYDTDLGYTCHDWTSTDVDVPLPIGHSWPRRLDGTDPGEAHWIYTHSNCTTGGGRPGSTTSEACNGCGANINLTNSISGWPRVELASA